MRRQSRIHEVPNMLLRDMGASRHDVRLRMLLAAALDANHGAVHDVFAVQEMCFEF
jgi:hypothetical protein